MLISVLGIWIPGCSQGWRYQQFNHSNTSGIELQDCGFHSVQTMGPLIVLIGLCFFVIAHIKKKQNLNLIQESSVSEEQLNSESFQVTVGIVAAAAAAAQFHEGCLKSRRYAERCFDILS
ncbi:hypothetical protein Chor_007870 [Crotalus horridus]